MLCIFVDNQNFYPLYIFFEVVNGIILEYKSFMYLDV